MNFPIISLDWLLDCIQHRMKLPVTNYLLEKRDSKYEHSTGKRKLSDLNDDQRIAKVAKSTNTILKKLADEEFLNPAYHFAICTDKEAAWDATFIKIKPRSGSSAPQLAIRSLQILRQLMAEHYLVWSCEKIAGLMTEGNQTGLGSFEEAKSTFMRLFEEATGLSWNNRHEQPIASKFIFVELDYKDEDANLSDAKPTICASKDAVISLIAGTESLWERLITATMQQKIAGIATGTKYNFMIGKQEVKIYELRVALALLKQLLDHPDLANGKSSKSQSVMNLTSAYHLLIPASQSSFTGRRNWVEREYDDLSYQRITSLVSQKEQPVDHRWVEAQLGDQIHRALGLRKMDLVDFSSTEYMELENYFNYSAESFGYGQQAPVKVRNIFRIESTGEADRYNAAWESKYKSRGFQRRLLWHGSPKTNFVGILDKGLVNYGNRIFLSDFAGISVGYSQKHSLRALIGSAYGMELMLLCEVAIDKKLTTSHEHRDAKCVHEDLEGIVMLDAGVGDKFSYDPLRGWPLGKQVKYEYSFSDADQILMRYLFQFEVVKEEYDAPPACVLV